MAKKASLRKSAFRSRNESASIANAIQTHNREVEDSLQRAGMDRRAWTRGVAAACLAAVAFAALTGRWQLAMYLLPMTLVLVSGVYFLLSIAPALNGCYFSIAAFNQTYEHDRALVLKLARLDRAELQLAHQSATLRRSLLHERQRGMFGYLERVPLIVPPSVALALYFVLPHTTTSTLSDVWPFLKVLERIPPAHLGTLILGAAAATLPFLLIRIRVREMAQTYPELLRAALDYQSERAAKHVSQGSEERDDS